MILSGKEIARHIGEEIMITPFNPKRLNPNSYNLTLADELMVYDNYELDMKKKNIQKMTVHKNAQPFSTILPKYFLSECMI